ncbi:MAG TPA: hypothetical protein DEF41_08880 [Desulfovibrio sp.]|nr:hypothetical protein [Desulfovibrio sp.]
MHTPCTYPLRLGRIGYLNVLPIYHPLETGIIPHEFDIVAGPPAVLNNMMAHGDLHVSATSSIEYGRHADDYLLVPDMAIGSRGPVMSVLLLSRRPVEELAGQTVLVSAETHTSAALLRLLFREYYRFPVSYVTGCATTQIAGPEAPEAFLAIGDEALRLRNHPDYPHVLDLGEAWRQWTGLPFIFGVWVVSRAAAAACRFSENPADLLRRARDWGEAHMDTILDLTLQGCPLTREELRVYYDGLVYHLGDEEQEGLRLFYSRLAASGDLARAPALAFFGA